MFFQADQGVTEIPIWQPPTPAEPAEDTSIAVAADVPDLEDATRSLTLPEKSRPDERPRRKSSNIRNEAGESNDFSAPPSSKLEQVIKIHLKIVPMVSTGNTAVAVLNL
jgi:hypothetical protein